MKKKVIFSLLIATFVLSYTSTAIAQSSPSPSPSPISDETITENLKKRLQETIGENVTTTPTKANKSFVGVIRDVIKNTLVVEDKDGKKNVMITDGAAIVRSPGNATIKADSIRIDDYVIAIGTLRESDELEAVRVIVSTTPITTVVKKAEVARITKIAPSTLTLSTLVGGETKTITINAKTALKSSLGESLEVKDLSVGDSIIYTAIENKTTLTATSLMRIGFADPEASTSPSPSTL